MDNSKERPYSIRNRKWTDIGRFRIIQDTLEIGGRQYPFSYMHEQDCVCIVPIFEEQVVLISQYRHAIDAWQLEIPCGAIEEGEAPEMAAKRELREETGYSAGHMLPLGQCYVRAGVSDAKVYFFLAFCTAQEEWVLDATELITIRPVAIQNMDEMIQEGCLTQLLGVSCWLRARRHLVNK